eukprot:223097-Amphidinium_carterae.1
MYLAHGKQFVTAATDECHIRCVLSVNFCPSKRERERGFELYTKGDACLTCRPQIPVVQATNMKWPNKRICHNCSKSAEKVRDCSCMFNVCCGLRRAFSTHAVNSMNNFPVISKGK